MPVPDTARSGSPYRPQRTFEVEQGSPQRPGLRRGQSNYASEAQAVLATSVAKLVSAQMRPFAISGRIPIDPADLTLFFRTKSGITHSLDFPIDTDYDTPPALDVLQAAATPYPAAVEDYSGADALCFPPHLPLTTSLELSNHPLMDAVRATLFPALPAGHYLIATRDRLDVVPTGASLPPQPPANDMRVANLMITLPVRHRSGGALRITASDGATERFPGRGGRSGGLDWAAWMSDASAEVEPVTKGVRASVLYALHVRSFGPAGGDPLIAPGDEFLDALAPVLNLCRGRNIALHMTGDYNVNPSEVLAESLTPHLKGGDSMLYHAFKLYKLAPELRWTAGPYVWPVDRPVDLEAGAPPDGSPYARALSAAGDDTAMAALAHRAAAGGAVPLAHADIVVLSDRMGAAPVSKERVPFINDGALDKLVVNLLLVVYVP
ncbi:hypothetical protein PENSPDRAFT_675445 [Peniophora sp. CONT]|nr:hypothetical protein PENSPDRAFT_675445 [Peniophora sp. CONT]